MLVTQVFSSLNTFGAALVLITHFCYLFMLFNWKPSSNCILFPVTIWQSPAYFESDTLDRLHDTSVVPTLIRLDHTQHAQAPQTPASIIRVHCSFAADTPRSVPRSCHNMILIATINSQNTQGYVHPIRIQQKSSPIVPCEPPSSSKPPHRTRARLMRAERR